jgi:Tfp pilus assembly protein PilN/Tfp pilus assembly PilM family ATPase
MARTLTRLASMLKPIGGGADDLVAVKLHHNALTVAEVRHKSNVIKIDQLASTALPRKLDTTNSGRQQDMIRDTIISLGEQTGFATRDAGMIVPGDVVQIDMPYISPTELESEGQDPNFWSEQEPDIGKLQDPYIVFDTLVSSEDDDLTRVVVAYAETAQMQHWSDTLLGARLNPVHLELEPVALANYVYSALPPEDRTKAQAILNVTHDRMELIAFLPQRFHVVKMNVTEFDQVLLAEIENVQDTVGEFWDEVGGRVGNMLKQAVLFLQEEQDFPEFPCVHLVVDALRAQNYLTLMTRHFTLAPLRLLDPTQNATMAMGVQGLLSQVANKSGFTSALGLGLRRLGTFGNEGPGLVKLSMLPQAPTLRKNRQLGVVARTLLASWAAAFLIMATWTGGSVMPGYLSSKAESGIYDAIKAEATASQARIGQINQAVAALDGQLQSLNALSRQRGTAVIIESIPDLVPEGVELSAYYLSGESELRLRGAARSIDVVTLFASELANSGLVEPPAVGDPVYREGSPIFDFEITTRLRQES